MADTPSPEKVPDPNRFDPWSGAAFGGLRWFALSTAAHVGLLFLFATVTLTVIRTVEEIRVKVVEDAPPQDVETPQDWEGLDSLKDLAGVLKPEKTSARSAAPAGPKIQGVRAPDLPRIGGLGPKLGAGPSVDTLASTLTFGGGGGGGTGAIGGLGGGFGDYVQGLRKVGLDVVLVIDTTDSMQFVIDDVKKRLSVLVGTIHRLVPTARIGIVVYRDRGDEYIVKWSDLSFNTRKLQDFLANITAGGGGDWEEAVKEALEAAVNELKWRKQSKKVIILVGGSPPHPEDVNGVLEIVREFRADGGYVSAIDVTARQHDEFDRSMWRAVRGFNEPYQPSPMPEFYADVARSFTTIAKSGGGEYIALEQDKALVRSILELTFGSRWKVEMSQYLKELS